MKINKVFKKYSLFNYFFKLYLFYYKEINQLISKIGQSFNIALLI